MDFYKNLKIDDIVVVSLRNNYSLHKVVKTTKTYIKTESIDDTQKCRFNMKGDIYGSLKGNSIFLTQMSEESYHEMMRLKLRQDQINELKTNIIDTLNSIKSNHLSVKQRLENMLTQLNELKDIVDESV